MAEATLDELKEARDKIVSGQNEIEIQTGDQMVKFGPGNLPALERRIRELDGPKGPTIVKIRSEKGW